MGERGALYCHVRRTTVRALMRPPARLVPRRSEERQDERAESSPATPAQERTPEENAGYALPEARQPTWADSGGVRWRFVVRVLRLDAEVFEQCSDTQRRVGRLRRTAYEQVRLKPRQVITSDTRHERDDSLTVPARDDPASGVHPPRASSSFLAGRRQGTLNATGTDVGSSPSGRVFPSGRGVTLTLRRGKG